MMSYYQHQNPLDLYECHYQNSEKLHHQMLARSHYTHTFLYHYFFTIPVAPNKQFLNSELLLGFLVNNLNNRQFTYLQFRSSNCFVLQSKDLYQILFPFYIQNVLCKKAAFNDLSLELYTHFDFKLRT